MVNKWFQILEVPLQGLTIITVRLHSLPNFLTENTGTEEYLKYGNASFQSVHNFN